MNEENKTRETAEQNEPVVEAETVPAASDGTSVLAEEPLPVAPEQPEAGEPVSEPAEEIKIDPAAAPSVEETKVQNVSEPAEHSARYEKVLEYYKSGSWNEKQVRNAVTKGWITTAEFTEITGKEY